MSMNRDQIEKDFVEQCKQMSTGQLRGYLHSCLNKLSQREEVESRIPQNEATYNKLIELLHSKLSKKSSNFIAKEHRKKSLEQSNYEIERLRQKKKKIFLIYSSLQVNEANELSPSLNLEKLSWTILPVGNWIFDNVVGHFNNLNSKSKWRGRKFDKNRLAKIESQLSPTRCYIGKKEFEGYVVYCFDWTKKVVLECPFYGNASYVIEGNWKQIAKDSKWNARHKYSKQVTVIRHTDLWFENLKTALRFTSQHVKRR